MGNNTSRNPLGFTMDVLANVLAKLGECFLCNNVDFSFELRQANRLSRALEVLTDAVFNPSGEGRVDVNEDGLRFTVQNPGNVVGYLQIPVESVGNFRYYRPLVGKMVNLRLISEKLAAGGDYLVRVAHERGSNDISFSFGNDPSTEFTAEFLENTIQIPECPDVHIACEAFVRTADLENLTQNLVENGRDQIVSVDIMSDNHIATNLLRAGNLVTYDSQNWRVEATRGAAEIEGLQYRALFNWPYPEAMMKAILLYPAEAAVTLRISNQPRRRVIVLFRLQDHGILVFLQEADEIFNFNQETESA